MGKRKIHYDAHLLYHALNMTAELRYMVPMERIYKILEKAEKYNETHEPKITEDEIIEVLSTLGNTLEDSMTNEAPPEDNNLQSKIKEILRLLGCHLSEQELNKILKGELSLDEALSKKARIAWSLVFDIDEKGRMRPNKELVEDIAYASQIIAFETIERNIQKEQIERASRHKSRDEGLLRKSDNLKTLYRTTQKHLDPVVLEQKRRNLKLYIAHMQGYDRDRDRDGGRGIDMTTGEIIDFGDIYIADKEHGAIIEDIGRDGIDMADIH